MLKNLALVICGLLYLSLGIWCFQTGTNKMELSQDSQQRKHSKSLSWAGLDGIFFGSLLTLLACWELRESVLTRRQGQREAIALEEQTAKEVPHVPAPPA